MKIGRRDLIAAAAAGAAATLVGRRAAAEPAPARLPPGAQSRFVNANGVRLHYVIAGAGPAVVLLHGWPQTSFAWTGTIERLARRFTLIAPDLRGTGLSEKTPSGYDKRTIAADVAALIEAVAGGRAAVVGHDMGGKAAYMLALTSPERVSKLVLVDCAVPGTENMDVSRGGLWHYGFHMARDFPEALTAGRERDYIAAQIRAWSHVKDAIGEDAISEYAGRYAAPGGMTAGFNLYRALPEDAALAASLKARRFAIPVMTVAGRHSVGDNLAKAMEPQAPGHIAVIVEDCGHFVAEEALDLFCERLEAFLAG